ncbi:hypothetical protein QIO77_gp4 [ssRNA phage Gerhypos.2_35]|uniref:Uncharacterized protein n=2 Tax=Leviviricetes TaxID=2842243 RepID=A0A8S5KZ34_9VIRU|nr:hypothetical protein QIO77_gp4 [ssRNA phage Gerhypos.2_35]QDH89300.1 MAG: hypothetical protein H2Bulk3637_000004 [Leviviridae sp.]DAD50325.1 TPA_asm: hypothetical protein [ssRNA phage Gerhypos.2_35]
MTLNEAILKEAANYYYSVEKLRVLALLYIPEDATARDARAWLDSQRAGLPPAVVKAVIHLHLKDNVLKEWRKEEMAPTLGSCP